MSNAMATKKRDQLISLMARMDGHFAADDQSPADRDDWKALKRHIVGMLDGLTLVASELRERRERGMAFDADVARKVEGYAKFGLGAED
jgi:hypothetical protein